MQAKKRAFDKKNSRVKLVVYDKSNIQKSWYSFPSDERKGYEYTIRVMEHRILAKLYNNRFNHAIFYNNATDGKILDVSPQSVAKNIIQSKVKLIVYDKHNQKHTFFSSEQEDKQEQENIIGTMSVRLLQYKLSNNYNCAIFYDINKDEEIARFSQYGRINY